MGNLCICGYTCLKKVKKHCGPDKTLCMSDLLTSLQTFFLSTIHSEVWVSILFFIIFLKKSLFIFRERRDGEREGNINRFLFVPSCMCPQLSRVPSLGIELETFASSLREDTQLAEPPWPF